MRELFQITYIKNRNVSRVRHSENAKVAKYTLGNEIQNDIITLMTKIKSTIYTTFVTTTKCYENYN